MVARLKLKGIDGRAPPGVEPAALLKTNWAVKVNTN